MKKSLTIALVSLIAAPGAYANRFEGAQGVHGYYTREGNSKQLDAAMQLIGELSKIGYDLRVIAEEFKHLDAEFFAKTVTRIGESISDLSNPILRQKDSAARKLLLDTITGQAASLAPIAQALIFLKAPKFADIVNEYAANIDTIVKKLEALPLAESKVAPEGPKAPEAPKAKSPAEEPKAIEAPKPPMPNETTTVKKPLKDVALPAKPAAPKVPQAPMPVEEPIEIR